MDTKQPQLDDTSRTKLDGIVQQMVANKEPDTTIQAVVDDFKQKYATAPVTPPAPSTQNASPLPFQNLPKPTAGEVFNMLPGSQLLKDVGRSASAIYQGAKGGVQKLLGNNAGAQASFQKSNAATDAIEPMKDFGSGANLALTAAPVGEFVKPVQAGLKAFGVASKAAPLLAKGAVGAAEGYGFDVSNKVANGSSVSDGDTYKPGLGTAIGGSIPFVSALTSSLAKTVTGAMTGTGSDVIQRAIDNPEAVGSAIKTYAKTPEAKQELVDRAKAGISTFLSGRSQEYGSSLAGLGGDAAKLAETGATVTKSFSDNIGKFGGKIDSEGALTFANTSLTKTDQAALKDAWDTIGKWDDFTPQGLDTLRQAIGNHMDDFKFSGNSRANAALAPVKDKLSQSLSANLPGYSDMLSNYGQKSQVAREVMKELNLGGNARPSTQLNSIMRLFKKDPTVLEKLSTIMGKDESQKFMNDISGAILSDWIPAGKMGNYVRALGELGAAGTAVATASSPLATGVAATLAASSPRIVGTAATLLGKASKNGVGTVLKKATLLGASKLK